MRVLLKNMGDANRVFYDATRKAVVVAPGKSAVADLPDSLITHLRAAMAQGATLHCDLPPEPKKEEPEPEQTAGRGRRVRTPRASGRKKISTDEPAPKKKEEKVITPSDVLATASELDYHTLLSMTNKALPDHTLGPRPTKEAMLNALRRAVPPAD